MRYEAFYRRLRTNYGVRALFVVVAFIVGIFVLIKGVNIDNLWIMLLSFALIGWPTIEFIIRVFLARTRQEMEDEENDTPRMRYYTVEVRERIFGGSSVEVNETSEPLASRGIRAIVFLILSLLAIILSPITSPLYLVYLIVRVIQISLKIKRETR